MINTSKTKIPLPNCEFQFDFLGDQRVWCTYSHALGERLMYVGFCEFRKILEANDARRFASWREEVSPHKDVIVKVHSLFHTRHEALNEAARLIRLLKPYCNMQGGNSATTGEIKCENDGKVFASQAHAAKFYGISSGAMSNHMNRRPGYHKIHGLIFKRLPK